jgi:rubrerythrin
VLPGDETFDISVDKPLWLMVSIRDRALIGKHDTVGREYICLDPRLYGDFLAHDIWKTLDTQGRILLRISMEGEKDDIQFYFGRAFRSLKRAESDMLRIFIDKVRVALLRYRNLMMTCYRCRHSSNNVFHGMC